MVRLVFLRSFAAAAPFVAVPAPLLAVTPPTNSSGSVAIVHPLTLQKLEDMDFGGLTVTTAGTAVIDPIANSMSVTGGVTAVSGTPHAARFRGAASGGPVVNIKIPNQPITLTRVGGTQTMTLSNFTLDGPSKRTMGQAAFFDFRVGGRLNVAANQAEGAYIGTFTVTAQYP
jgi:hypothetical protein